MNISIGQTILCQLDGARDLTERVVASFSRQHAIHLEGGDVILPDQVFAVLSS